MIWTEPQVIGTIFTIPSTQLSERCIRSLGLTVVLLDLAVELRVGAVVPFA